MGRVTPKAPKTKDITKDPIIALTIPFRVIPKSFKIMAIVNKATTTVGKEEIKETILSNNPVKILVFPLVKYIKYTSFS